MLVSLLVQCHVYTIFIFNGKVMKIFIIFLVGGISLFVVHGASAVDTDRLSVFVMERDSVTLHISVSTNKEDRVTWYFKDYRIAQINGAQSKICADDQCKQWFQDRLNVNQTGSLTIMNIRNTDSGQYEVKITSRNTAEIFSVTVLGVSAAKSVKEGENVTLDAGVIKNPKDLMVWYFNGTCIAEITGDQSKICTNDQCEERFRDRLKLDNENGSLTITNTRITDSGEYQLKNSRSSFSIIRSFTVTVTYVLDSGSSSVTAAAVVVVFVVLLLLVIVAVVFYKCQAVKKLGIRRQLSDQVDGSEDSLEQTNGLMRTSNGTSPESAVA